MEETVAHYRVESLIGTGGMGEVYRAVDMKLGRAVALKILSPELSQSRLRIRRFLQEAKAASSLNHPNILTVYDAGEASRVHFIASELIEGSTLRDVIHRDRVPLKRIVTYLAQAADGIAKAHAAGIVHRDLKPDNIMVTTDGFAKVLDFGLAKLAEAPDDVVGVSDPTREGVVVGTAAYMSPEQAQGKRVDHRSDIFSFGAILYEAAARKRPFSGDSDPDTLHRIIHADPEPLSGIPSDLERVIMRSIQKDPEDRIQSMKDVALELRDISRSFDNLRVLAAPRGRFAMTAAMWSAIAVVAMVLGLVLGRTATPRAAADPIRFTIAPPDKTFFAATANSSTALQFAVSPDGKSIVFVAGGADGRQQLWLRQLDSINARPLEGTNGAWFPFWSPRGDAVGFFASSKLKRIPIGSSEPVTIADAADPRGASWGKDGVILFSVLASPVILRVPESGGEVHPATAISPARELAHRWPAFLPDGKRFLFTSRSPNYGLFAGSLDSKETRRILDDVDSNAAFVAPNEILFMRRGSLYVQRVDPATIQPRGDPELIEQHVGFAPVVGYGSFSASNHDLIVFAPRVNPNRQFTWFDRKGRIAGTAGEPGDWASNTISVVRGQALVGKTDFETATQDVWTLDLKRDIATPLTSDAHGQGGIWSPDGAEIAYTSYRRGLSDIYLRELANPKSDRLIVKGVSARAWSWTPDGRYIIYWDRSPQTKVDLWMINPHDGSEPRPLVRTPAAESDGVVSPDGRWLAYASDDSGREEVYVTPFLREGTRYQISSTGGNCPVWSGDGRELYYMTANREIAAATITAKDARLEAAKPLVLFRVPGLVSAGPAFQLPFAVGEDGRFLVNVTPAPNVVPSLTAVVHWR